MNKDYKKAEAQLTKEMHKQIRIIYPACAIVLWQQYGWRNNRITNRFVTSSAIWHECADYGDRKNMLQMLEEETGVNLQLTGCADWHTLQYVDWRAWDGKQITLPEITYMRQMQKKWVALELLAGVCLTMHREERWGTDRIGKFIGLVDKLRKDIGENPEAFAELLEEVTGIRTSDMWGEKDE